MTARPAPTCVSIEPVRLEPARSRAALDRLDDLRPSPAITRSARRRCSRSPHPPAGRLDVAPTSPPKSPTDADARARAVGARAPRLALPMLAAGDVGRRRGQPVAARLLGCRAVGRARGVGCVAPCVVLVPRTMRGRPAEPRVARTYRRRAGVPARARSARRSRRSRPVAASRSPSSSRVGAVALALVGVGGRPVTARRAAHAPRHRRRGRWSRSSPAPASGPPASARSTVARRFVLVVVVTRAVDGMGNVDGLVARARGGRRGGASSRSRRSPHQDGLADGPRRLRGGLLRVPRVQPPPGVAVRRAAPAASPSATTLAVGALAVQPVPGAWREPPHPADRARRARCSTRSSWWSIGSGAAARSASTAPTISCTASVALGWSTGEAVALLVLAQVLLVGDRGVHWPGGDARVARRRGRRGRARSSSPSRRSVPASSAIRPGLEQREPGLVVGIVRGRARRRASCPLRWSAQPRRRSHARGQGRRQSRAVAPRGDGDTHHRAGRVQRSRPRRSRGLATSSSRRRSPPGLAVPGRRVQPARRAHARRRRHRSRRRRASRSPPRWIPRRSQVVDGRLPLDEVRQGHPALVAGLDGARQRAAPRRRDHATTRTSHRRCATRSTRSTGSSRGPSARRATPRPRPSSPPRSSAATDDRRYLLVVQNPAEARATGGFIGELRHHHRGRRQAPRRATLHPHQRVERRHCAPCPIPTIAAPDDYLSRYVAVPARRRRSRT